MLRERADLIRSIVYVMDLIVLSVNFFLIYIFLLNHEAYGLGSIIPGGDIIQVPADPKLYLQAYWLALILWTIVLKKQGEYHHLRVQTYGKAALNLLVIGVLFFVLFTSIAFLLKYAFLSRIYMVLYTVSSIVLLLINRIVILFIAHTMRSHGYNTYNILIVGTGRRAQQYLSLAIRHKEWGYRIVGFIDKDPKMAGKKISEYPVLGLLDDLPKVLEHNVIDEVVFVIPRNWLPAIEKCILYCEAVGIPATLATDFFDLEIAAGVPKELDGFTYLTFETSHLKDAELFVKRMVDILMSLVILTLCLPLFAAVALLIRLEGPGPVFFAQIRSGLNGRRFKLYKFRSMIPDAENKLKELMAQNEVSGPVFKMTNDPRLTRVGRFLRRTSIDEFPQFWNVLKGDMSMVGPRPPLPSEVEQYEPWQRRRLSMKPGITCIWQVSGRNQIAFEDWMKLDLQYIDRWSLWLDVTIMMRTIRAVVGQTGK